VLAFIVAQLIGAATAVLLGGWLWASAEYKRARQEPVIGGQTG
jgi:glycerol uptake facilitator-like aquaporin